ncbi:acetyl/propionyl-CoA carboxylase subunit alpha [Corynebacterium yudongzhengii]|uniref:ATP-grasp domain-containing protein n=1 Tax=Corynebacterium yudongzhengii TaxID=2080740 RepID=A0A2U1T6M5_9CORY|nr:biotin carboxylase N-terminal domain-containing protein [Corynebacterium yudongzhengii]AWB82188.1 acetyl/propionyl-CoA carboxylase subunit alpha [Corynebacterium yudongzhengii]PWC01639.1 ATP-grasp domain-containing protein [Corynebacterium yudongzhengii]
MSTQITSCLIANRGEIAVRIIRTARDLGIRTIAVYSDDDADALHARLADEAYRLPGETTSETYLSIEALLDVARRAHADSVHPGYGFLSENADFARAVADNGMTWIGPTPEAIEVLGDKLRARALAEKVGAPLAPGTPDPIDDWQEARDFAEAHGLPIAIKAAYGGGGRGIKVVWEAEEIEAAFASAGREAQEAFGRPECFVEKFLVHPRHVEAQVLADTHGNVRVLGTRDCSVQRRYQKLIEEAPAPFLSEEQERSIIEGARAICEAADYVSAGTVEYIVSEDGTVSFLEVNTRVQVEHPVTEAVTGIDIVAEQFRIAAGEKLSFDEDSTPHGHAFEFRINAEDVSHGFIPNPGEVTEFAAPTGPGVRTDSGVVSGSVIPGAYDSMLAKVIVSGRDRASALRRAADALNEITVRGVRTVIPFHRDMLAHPAFAGDELKVYTNWVDTEYTPGEALGYEDIEQAYTERTTMTIDIDGRLHTVGIPTGLLGAFANAPSAAEGASEDAEADAEGVTSPLAGSLVSWSVEDGAEVTEGQTVAIAEAMKMETPVTAPQAGRIRLRVEAGEKITRGQVLAVYED